MTNYDFYQAAVKIGLVPEAAVEDWEGYDGGETLHQLSVMWTIVCEQLNAPTVSAESPRE